MGELSDNGQPVYGTTTQAPFQTAVTTAGTRVQLSTSTIAIAGVYLSPKPTNTAAGIMYVGTVTVSGTVGFGLQVGQTIFYPCETLSEIYVDSTVNGEIIQAWPVL